MYSRAGDNGFIRRCGDLEAPPDLLEIEPADAEHHVASCGAAQGRRL
jgi:hypothetical protein